MNNAGELSSGCVLVLPGPPKIALRKMVRTESLESQER